MVKADRSIGVMGEYDALPGLSQKALAEKAPLVEGAAGQWLRPQPVRGGESRAAAIAIKEQIESVG